MVLLSISVLQSAPERNIAARGIDGVEKRRRTTKKTWGKISQTTYERKNRRPLV